MLKKMNKKQLIEWFIENYGSHPTLAQFFTTEEIEERLNQNITEVTYSNEPNNALGSYDAKNGILNLDARGVTKHTIVHELLHALSLVYKNENGYQLGFEIYSTEGSIQENTEEDEWIKFNDGKRKSCMARKAEEE